MTAPTAWIATRLSNRPDTEHRQALVRLALVTVYFLYILSVILSVDHPRVVAHRVHVVLLMAGSYAVTFAILAAILARPGASVPRRIAGMVHDNLATGVLMYLLDRHGIPAYIVYLWVTFGNGFRYGRRYLYLCGGMAVLSFSAVIPATPYWRGHPDLSLTLLAAIIVLPMYVSNLLRILERKQADLERGAAELFQEKERAQITLKSIADGVIVTDADGAVTTMNPAAEQITGWPEAEAVRRPVAEVLPPDPQRTPENRDDTGGGPEAPHGYRRVKARDGSERDISESAAPIRDESGATVGGVLILRDVTARRKIDAEILRIDKIESLGMLAGGIAHDFNNLLTAILGNVDIAALDAPAGSRQAERLEKARKASMIAKSLSARLLTFAKGGAPVKRPHPIGPVVQEAADLALRGSHIRFEYDIPDDLWFAEIDDGQVSQTVNGIAVNAVHAMPNGGVLRMSARNLVLAEGRAPHLPAGDYVEVSIADSGVGIPRENLGKVFDPYFTTKKHGTGLGLATAYSVMKSHGGHVAVESSPGAGATFRLYFPAQRKARPRRDVPEAAPESRLAPNGGLVLVMDDEEMVRDMLCQMLATLGYDAVATRDGAEAIKAYAEAHAKGRPFDLVITDLTVPGGMGGKEMANALLAIYPDARIIVSTGYSDNPVMSLYLQHGFRGRIGKPYRIRDLKAALEEAARTPANAVHPA